MLFRSLNNCESAPGVAFDTAAGISAAGDFINVQKSGQTSLSKVLIDKALGLNVKTSIINIIITNIYLLNYLIFVSNHLIHYYFQNFLESLFLIIF